MPIFSPDNVFAAAMLLGVAEHPPAPISRGTTAVLSVIGIHSKIRDHDGSVTYHSGHAWLTLHYTNGRRASVGLWPDKADFTPDVKLRLVVRDPIGISQSSQEQYRVQWDKELLSHYRPDASRYYGLRRGDQNKAIAAIGEFAGWRVTNNCTTWATEKIKKIFGASISHTEFLGVLDTPRSLGAAILRLESKRASKVDDPIYS
jgi:hypothetical protein